MAAASVKEQRAAPPYVQYENDKSFGRTRVFENNALECVRAPPLDAPWHSLDGARWEGAITAQYARPTQSLRAAHATACVLLSSRTRFHHLLSTRQERACTVRPSGSATSATTAFRLPCGRSAFSSTVRVLKHLSQWILHSILTLVNDVV